MLHHYLKVAIRNLSSNKVFSIINILGLAVGMGVCLLIYQYIHFEMSFDNFHLNGENTFRVISTAYQNEEQVGHGVESPYMMGIKGRQEIPEITNAIRVHPQYGAAVVVNPATDEKFIELDMLYVEDSFLEVFNFELKTGNPGTVLKEPNSVVLTEEMAIKYFGSSDPVGQVLKISGEWTAQKYIVTGVVKSPPANSHLKFVALIPMQNLLENEQYKSSDGWSWYNFVTYVTLSENANVSLVEEKLQLMHEKYKADDFEASERTLKIEFQPVREVHLGSKGIADPISKNIGNRENIKIYSIVSVFIIVIAWINYINLSTAQSMQRAKEVGVRKSVGAHKKQLVKQFLIEAGLTNAFSALLAIGIAYFLLPLFNDILGLSLELSLLWNLEFWGWFLVIILFGILVSGMYPALMLSSFKTVSMLKSSSAPKTKNIGLRQILIVFQYATSILMIAGAMLVYHQINFMKKADHGMAMDQILILTGPKVGITRESIKTKLQTFKNQLKAHHSISEVAGSENIPSRGYNWGASIRRLGSPELEEESTKIVFVDHDFLNTYDIELVAGSSFDKERKFSRGVLVNEATLKTFGAESPEQVLMEKFIIDTDTIEVAGVLKNYNWSSLKDKHEPYCFALFGESLNYFSLRVNLQNLPETVAHAEDVFREVFPNDAFEYFFLEDEFNRQYQTDLQFGKLIGGFTILAIFIACLGLFALVSYSTSLRVKEIGIRKVLGASLQQLMFILSREYMILLLVANFIGLPIVYYVGMDWLENYAFRIDLSPQFFIIPGIVLVIISILTVSYQTYATAKANPVDSLRSE